MMYISKKYHRDGSTRAVKLDQYFCDVLCTLPNEGCDCMALKKSRKKKENRTVVEFNKVIINKRILTYSGSFYREREEKLSAFTLIKPKNRHTNCF